MTNQQVAPEVLRNLKLQGLVFALARLTCLPPLAPAVQHQLERLIDFYFEGGDDDFARKLVSIKNGALSSGRRSVLVPSAAPTTQPDKKETK